MPDCLIAVGSSLGDRSKNIEAACQAIDALPATRLVCCSRLIETRPVGRASGEFLNGCLVAETGLPPRTLMDRLLEIESAGGRIRAAGNSVDRTIDLDILLFGERIVRQPGLSIPHPAMSFRRFVLEPAAEIAPGMRHPLLGSTASELLCGINRPARQIGWVGPALRTDPVSVEGWTLVPLTAEPETPLADSLNLLIEPVPPATSRSELRWPEYGGPRWQTGLGQTARWPDTAGSVVDTAIASMAGPSTR